MKWRLDDTAVRRHAAARDGHAVERLGRQQPWPETRRAPPGR
jgi:hypothetical protein